MNIDKTSNRTKFLVFTVVFIVALLFFSPLFTNLAFADGDGGGTDGGGSDGSGAGEEAAGQFGGPDCVANIGFACYSSANACGQTSRGTIQCDGTCSASTPSNPSRFGSTCYSSANSCNQRNRGTIQCNGTCSVGTPSNPAGFGSPCQSAPNSVGQTNSGTIQCDGTCSAITPPNPEPVDPSILADGETDEISIISGDSATITYSCVDSVSSAGVNFSTGGATSGSVEVSPLVDTEYIVVCSNGGQGSVNVNVFSPELNISAVPPRVRPGRTSLITWSTLGDDDILSCSVSGPNFSASGKDGSQITVPITEESTYTLTCPTTQNTLSESATVKLVPAFEEF